MNPENGAMGPLSGQSVYEVPQYQVVVSWPPLMGGLSYLIPVPPNGGEHGAQEKASGQLTPPRVNPVLQPQTEGGIQWRTKREIARHFRCNIRTITKYMKRRVLPFMKIGRVVRFDLAKCDQAMQKFIRRSQFED